MKFKKLILIVFALISVNAFSQIKLGVRAGLSSSSISASDINQNGYQISSLSKTWRPAPQE